MVNLPTASTTCFLKTRGNGPSSNMAEESGSKKPMNSLVGALRRVSMNPGGPKKKAVTIQPPNTIAESSSTCSNITSIELHLFERFQQIRKNLEKILETVSESEEMKNTFVEDSQTSISFRDDPPTIYDLLLKCSTDLDQSIDDLVKFTERRNVVSEWVEMAFKAKLGRMRTGTVVSDEVHRHLTFTYGPRPTMDEIYHEELPASPSSRDFHRQSLREPEFVTAMKDLNLVSSDPERLVEVLTSFSKWNFDVFELNDISAFRPMTSVVYTAFYKFGLLENLEIDPRCLLKYAIAVEDSYQSQNSYHNALHAADVTQSAAYIISAPAFQKCFTKTECAALLYSAFIHDVDHPGVTNMYLMNTESPLAMLYTDGSVLEHHHLAVAFRLINLPDCDIFKSLNKKKRQIMKKITSDLVLATDMSRHMGLVASLAVACEKETKPDDMAMPERIELLKVILHCADLSNPTKPLRLYKIWTKRVMTEFFRQGDLERHKGLEISPLCDRNTASIRKAQTGFIDYIVSPIYESLADLIGEHAKDMMENLEINRAYFESAKEDMVIDDHGFTNDPSFKVLVEQNENSNNVEPIAERQLTTETNTVTSNSAYQAPWLLSTNELSFWAKPLRACFILTAFLIAVLAFIMAFHESKTDA